MARKFWQSLSPHREGKKGAHPIPVDKTVKRGGMREDTLLKEDHIQEPLLTTLWSKNMWNPGACTFTFIFTPT